MQAQVTTANSGGYNATINNIYGTGTTATINNINLGTQDQFLHQTNETLNDIATGINSHNTQIQQLNQANAALSGANQAMLKQLEGINSQLAELKTNVCKPADQKPHYDDKNPWRYCWSCGKCKHTNCKCPNPKPGHIKEAHFRNQKGSSQEGF